MKHILRTVKEQKIQCQSNFRLPLHRTNKTLIKLERKYFLKEIMALILGSKEEPDRIGGGGEDTSVCMLLVRKALFSICD